MSPKCQNCFIWVDLSIKSMLERLVLKNAIGCTSQRLKWTSGAQVMIIFDYFIYKWSFSLSLSIGSLLELLVLKNAAQRTSQSLKRPSVARVMTCSRSRTLCKVLCTMYSAQSTLRKVLCAKYLAAQSTCAKCLAQSALRKVLGAVVWPYSNVRLNYIINSPDN